METRGLNKITSKELEIYFINNFFLLANKFYFNLNRKDNSQLNIYFF